MRARDEGRVTLSSSHAKKNKIEKKKALYSFFTFNRIQILILFFQLFIPCKKEDKFLHYPLFINQFIESTLFMKIAISLFYILLSNKLFINQSAFYMENPKRDKSWSI